MPSDQPTGFATLDRIMSLWEVATRWTGHDVSHGAEDPIAPAVNDAGISLMNAQLDGSIRIFHESGNEAFTRGPEHSWILSDGTTEKFYPLENELSQFGGTTYEFHVESIREGLIDSNHLKSVYLRIDDLAAWTIKERLPFPYFCLNESQKAKIEQSLSDDPEKLPTKVNQQVADKFWSRLSNSQRSRIMARVVAKKLWELNPNSTIAQIERHEMIQDFCGAKHYADKDTVRNWIKDIDPRDPAKRAGRPPSK